VPAGTHFGLDYSDWVVGPRFQGVKMVPPGTHFVWVSAAGSMGDLAPRTGFFFTSAAGDVAVARWDAEVELLQMVSPAQDDDVERLCEGV
jgi:A1 cistron-splicing factor AAR2